MWGDHVGASAVELAAALYSNRANAVGLLVDTVAATGKSHQKLVLLDSVLSDTTAAVALEPSYAKAYFRRASALVQMIELGHDGNLVNGAGADVKVERGGVCGKADRAITIANAARDFFIADRLINADKATAGSELHRSARADGLFRRVAGPLALSLLGSSGDYTDTAGSVFHFVSALMMISEEDGRHTAAARSSGCGSGHQRYSGNDVRIPETSAFGSTTYLNWKELGISVVVENSIVDAIHLYNNRVDGFSKYAGLIHPDLDINDTNADVVRRLGEPTKKGGGAGTQSAIWISYDFLPGSDGSSVEKRAEFPLRTLASSPAIHDRGIRTGSSGGGCSGGGLIGCQINFAVTDWEDRDAPITSVVLYVEPLE
jgi:hypothetical protein